MYPFFLTYLRAFFALFFPFSRLVRGAPADFPSQAPLFPPFTFAALTNEANKRLRIEICKPNTFLLLENFPVARSLSLSLAFSFVLDPLVRWPHKRFSTFHLPLRITTSSPTHPHSQKHALSSLAFKLPFLPSKYSLWSRLLSFVYNRIEVYRRTQNERRTAEHTSSCVGKAPFIRT